MTNAESRPCPQIFYPDDPFYIDEHTRRFQGCPTIAVTRGGRIFLGWYAGGWREPHMENFNLLVYSDDDGKTWSQPVFVIPSSKPRCVHANDIQLWISPSGALELYWVQNDTLKFSQELRREHPNPDDWYYIDGYLFGDDRHTEWRTVCLDPDAEKLTFSAPELLDYGFLRCKPLVLSSGRQINFNYDQVDEKAYGYSISDDGGKTFRRVHSGKKIDTWFDEAMAYERRDGSIRMFARAHCGELAECISRDGGETFEGAVKSGIRHADSRFFVSRTPSGRILLVTNDAKSRTNLTVFLSDDDGETFPYGAVVDTREQISYPDADFHGGKIYLTYDRERTGAKEILFLSFTEDDVISGRLPTPSVVSKP